MAKLQKGKNTIFLNIPKQYIQLLDWKKGTEILVYPAPNEKKALIIKEMPKSEQND